MKSVGIPHRRLWAVAFGAVVVAGCQVQPQLQLVGSNLFVPQRKEVNVGLAIPDATRSFSALREIRGGCLGGVQWMPSPYGENFSNTLRDRVSRLYANVSDATSGARGDGPDVILEATLTDLGYRLGCPISPETYVEVTASLRATDRQGREIWRNRQNTFRHPATLLQWDINGETGQHISKAIAGLVDSWVQELVMIPDQAYGLEPAARPVATARSPAGAERSAAFPKASLNVKFPKAQPNADDVAVIIGNADYSRQARDIPNVRPAYADAEAFRRYAIDTLGVREGNVIDLKDATGAQFVRVFGSKDNPRGQLFDWVRANRSRVYVYYAGHGAPAGADGSAYLVPTDADGARIELNGYPLATLYENLSKLPAQSVTVVLESCFSGASQAGSVISNASPVFMRPKGSSVPAGITVIAAGGSNQMASWEQDGSHGLFTKYYLSGMAGEADAKPHGNGDGRVGLDELDRYLKDTLTYYARRHYGRDQTAEIVAGKP